MRLYQAKLQWARRFLVNTVRTVKNAFGWLSLQVWSSPVHLTVGKLTIWAVKTAARTGRATNLTIKTVLGWLSQRSGASRLHLQRAELIAWTINTAAEVVAAEELVRFDQRDEYKTPWDIRRSRLCSQHLGLYSSTTNLPYQQLARDSSAH